MSAREDWLRAWFADRAPDVELTPGVNYFDAGAIDSFGVIELIEDAEAEFGIRFDEADFQDRRFATVEGLCDLIGEKAA